MGVLFNVMILITTTFFFWALLIKFFSNDKQIKRRVEQYISNETKSTEKKDEKSEKGFHLSLEFRLTKERIRKRLQRKNKNTKIDIQLQQAGIPLKPEEYVMFQWISITLGAGILYLLIDVILLIPVGAAVGYMIPNIIVKRRQKARLKNFNEHLPEMISTIVSALRAGFSFPQSLKTVANESPSPMKEEVEVVIKEMQYGSTLEESLNRLKERMPSEDLNLMIQAIVIQRQVGGNLAVVLEKIVETIRERIKIQGQISTLTAQGKLSGLVVGLLPLILAMILYVVSPEYISVLFEDPVGNLLLVIAAFSSLLGLFFIKKITTIEV